VVGPTHDDLPPLVASAEASVAQHRLAVAVDATVGEGALARFRLAAGLTPGAGGAPPALDQRAPMTAELVLDAALGRLTDYLPLEGTRIAGQATARIDVTGTPTAPVVAGTASLAEGEIDQSDAGLYLRNVRLEARGDGGRLVIDTLSASAVSGGTLEGGGSIGFAAASAVPADLRLTARGLVAVDLDEATVPIDADLALTGSLPDYLLAGTVTVLPSEIRIPDQMPPSVMTLEVVEIRDGVVVAKPPEARPAEARSPVGLDLRINIPGQVFVRGRGLDSEWGGALTVSGRADAPVVRGEIAVRRGNLDAVGRSFGFGRGRILFDGGPPADPGLDMLLSTRVAEIEARITVTGSARDPQIALGSEPALPEEEVLSRILFGSPRAQLSPLQALRLAQSAAVLSGRLGSGGGIADTLRETLGVDTLDFDTGDDSGGGASLSVGRYVAPGVFLKLQQGLGGETSKAVVEVELTDSITVETDVGADSQSRVGVNWKLDY
jgi:translocation and assembly module TamB